MTVIHEATMENIDALITENSVLVIDFWAPWCGPCRSFAPIFEAAAADHPAMAFAKANTEAEQQLGAYFQIRSIPTLMVFREQILMYSQAGALPRAALDGLVGSIDGFTQAHADALKALAETPDPIHYNAVSDALNIAEGRLTLGD